MATSFESTPKWFNADYYLGVKLAQLQAEDPKGGWTRETMLKVFVDNGFDNAYDHYLTYGDKEGLSPNVLFNNTEYLAAKAAQMGSAWTAEMVAKAIQDAGLTLMEHYERYGSQEGINPSKSFDQNKYFDAKLEQLMAAEPDKGWTLEKVKEAFAAAGMTPLDHFLIYAKEEGLQDAKYDYSETGKPIPHPGTEITLTTGIDVVGPDAAEGFVTSGRDDVINAVVSTVASKGTLNATDVIDGAGGRDVLNIDMQSGFGGFKDNGGVKNVETIALENLGGKTFDAKGVVAAEQYTMSLGAKTATIKNVDTTATAFVVSSDKGAELSVQFTDAAIAGKSDVATVMLNGVGEDGGSLKLTVGGASTSSAQAETLVLNSVGKGNFVNVLSKHEAIVVTNEADITLAANKGGLKSFDASSALGDVKANLSNNADTLKAINGGAGDDVITVSSLASGAVLNGGDGNDTLKFEAPAALSLKQHISGFETIEVVGNASATPTHVIDMANITDLFTLKYDGMASYTPAKATGTAPATESFEVKNSSVSDFTFQIQDKTTHTPGNVADPLRDPGSITRLVYDGTGSLNVELVGDTGTGFSGLNGLTAKNATALNFSTDHDKAGLLVMGITANSVENVTIDTTGGAGAAMYTGDNDRIAATASGSLSALQNIMVKGDGEVEIVANGTEKALTRVNATELKGSLSLDLSAIAAGTGRKGVDIHMGSGGTDGDLWDSGITGTKGNDNIHLGSGKEVVHLDTKLGTDNIFNLGTDDVIDLGSASAPHSGAYITDKTKLAADKIVGLEGGSLDFEGTKSDWAEAIVAAYGSTSLASAVGSNSSVYFAFDNGDDIGVFKVLVGASGSISAGTITAGDLTNLELIGVIKDHSLASFDEGSFIA